MAYLNLLSDSTSIGLSIEEFHNIQDAARAVYAFDPHSHTNDLTERHTFLNFDSTEWGAANEATQLVFWIKVWTKAHRCVGSSLTGREKTFIKVFNDFMRAYKAGDFDHFLKRIKAAYKAGD